jgi:hypothetical protein
MAFFLGKHLFLRPLIVLIRAFAKANSLFEAAWIAERMAALARSCSVKA